ncbi:MAG: hypothetical protein V5A44_12070 [Haloarculaceae archaeon]
MTTRAVAEMDDWDAVPFGGGYAGLRDLSDEEFSGIVQSGAAKCCLLNGTVVGVLDGSIEGFEDAEGTAYEAPTPALPLLALMQERGDEVRAKYYTEDTPLSEVDRTLSDGGFSGYIDLSENVLSGDYYVVYHAGRSMSVAWVGNMGELLTGDEAFQRADDEVGIYEVRQVDVEPVEIPGQSGDTGAGAAAASDAGTDTADEGAAAGGGTDEGTTTSTDDRATASDDADATESAKADDAATSSEPTAVGDAGEGSEASTGVDRDRPGAPGDDSTATGESPAGTDDDGATADGRVGEEAAGSDTAPEADRSTAGRARTEETPDTTDRDPAMDGASADEAGRTPGGADVAESTASTAETDARPTRTGRERSNADEAGSGGVDSGGARRHESATHPDVDAPGAEGPDAGSGVASPTERLATRSIPSLDPGRTTDDEESTGGAGAAAGTDRPRSGTGATGADRESESGRPASARSAESSPNQAREASGTGRNSAESGSDSAARAGGSGPSTERSSGPGGSGGSTGSRDADAPARAASSERVAELETALEEREAEIDRLESELASAEEERGELRRDLEAVREERDELAGELEEREAELDRVRTELNELEAEFGGATDAEQRLTPTEALDGTNLFVRYESKGKATLESAHGGSASREEVYGNLNLELHTQFDAASATVGSQPYDEFLRGTLQYRFVAWVVQELLWEIRDTGKVAALEDLYDAIPQIDRAELNGVVTVEFTEDGQQRRSEESFDIVLRDRMGNPLVVANLNDSRDAASQEMMNSLVTAASRVSEANSSLSAAVFVTSSFFEPEALETAADATSGSLLSRDKRESFVKLSRKRGYHLCLAEARDEQFHLAVPEL